MPLFCQPIHQRMPIFDPVALNQQQIYVGGRTEQPILKILAKSVVDSERHHERSHTCRNPGDGNAGNDTDDSLAPLGAEVASLAIAN